MSFTLFLFHFIILMLILPRLDCCSIIHDSGWCAKTILIFAIFGAFFGIDIAFFNVWVEICRYVSLLFMIVQTLYVLSGAYTFNEYMINNYPSGDESCRNVTMLIYTILLGGGAIAITVMDFFWFLGPSSDVDCGSNITLIVLTLVMIVVVFALRLRPDSSIFTSAMVSLWLAFLGWTALASQPDECNTISKKSWTTFVQIISHMLWTYITLISLSIASSDDDEKTANAVTKAVAGDANAENEAKGIEIQTTINKADTEKGDEAYVFPISLQTIVF